MCVSQSGVYGWVGFPCQPLAAHQFLSSFGIKLPTCFMMLMIKKMRMMITPWQLLPVSFPDDQAPLLLHHSSMSCFWAPRGPSNLPRSVTDMNDGSSEQKYYQNHHHHPDLICLWAFTLDLVPSASDQTVMGDRTAARTKTSQHTKGGDGNTNTKIQNYKYKHTQVQF